MDRIESGMVVEQAIEDTAAWHAKLAAAPLAA